MGAPDRRLAKLKAALPVKLAIACEGPLRRELEGLARTLRIEEDVTFVGEAQDVPSWLSALELEWSLLYGILKNRSARMTPVRKHPFQAALTLALLPLLLPMSLAMTLIEAALRRGGTIEVYAFKE